MFEQILELIQKAPRVIIHRHKNPDGDALGSQLGLKHILRDSFPDKEILAVGDMTDRYAFMADEPMDEVADEAYEGALAMVLDTSAKSLISDDRYTTAAKPVANNNLSATLTVNIGKLNDDAMIGLQVSSTGKPLTSEKLLASYSDEESLQKALTDGRIGISVYMSGDTYNRTYAFVTRDGKLYVYQTSATPK